MTLTQYPTYPPLVLNPPLNVTRITDHAGLALLEDFFERSGTDIGWDIETDVREHWSLQKIRTIQFGNSTEQFVIDLLAFEPDLVNNQGDMGRKLSPALKSVCHTFQDVICSRKFMKIGVNLKFEYTLLYWNFGLRSQYFFDCSLVERVIVAGLYSLKNFHFFSMEEIMQRYFGVQIDKGEQKGFDLVTPLRDEQWDYAALDTRLPFSIKQLQQIIISGGQHPGLSHFPANLLGDNLERVCALENDAIGAFADMEIHGDRLDCDKWNARVADKERQLADLITNKLDPIFTAIFGSFDDIVTNETSQQLNAEWKCLNKVPKEDMELRRLIHKLTKNGDLFGQVADAQAELERRTAARLSQKAQMKELEAEQKHLRSSAKLLRGKTSGNAVFNYNSPAQLIQALNDPANSKYFPGLAEALGKTRGGVQRLLEDLEEDSLREIEHVPVIALLQEKSKLSKQISTYGYNWTKEWASTGDYRDGPGKESGWLSPIDHRLHCNFNQLYAETGRSSSSRPNAQNIPRLTEMRSCFIVSDPDENAPEGYVMVTADMSGAELRILAELSGEPRWIEAFNRGEDVHDVCIETIDPDFWYSLPRLDNCDYFALKPDGEMQRKKCKCPSHNDARSAWKPTNFGLPYGIGPSSLTVQINKEVKVKKTIDDVREMMAMHQAAFPTTWKYLAMQSAIATALMKATDMFDRRRLFTVPEIDEATRRAHRRSEKELRLADDVCEENMKALKSICAAETPPRKPTKDEKWVATHRPLTEAEERASMDEMQGNIARQGKNHPIQGTNASIAKVAMGAGFDRDGSPYLWHTLPLWGARLIKFVHDELVVECPARYGQQVADLIGDAFKRAAAEVMRKVVMTFDYHINTYWEK